MFRKLLLTGSFIALWGVLSCADKHNLAPSAAPTDATAEPAVKCPAGHNITRLVGAKNHACIRQLLKMQPKEVNRLFSCCGTPLMSAALYGDLATAKLLISLGAKSSKVDTRGATALHYAVQGKNLALVKLLISKGVNVNIQDEDGATAMHRAAYHDTPKIAEVLIKHGANLKLRHRIYGTPFMHALDYGHPTVARIYLAHMKLDMSSADGKRVMFLVASSSNIALLPVMLKMGGDINVRNRDGDTPLHKAARYETPRVINTLITHGANPGARSNDGDTPLHRAALFRKEGNLEALLKGGAPVNAADAKGTTPLHMAVLVGTTERIKMFGSRRHGIKPGIRYRKVPPKMVKLLLSKGAKVSMKDSTGNTPLHIAAKRSECEIASLLIKKGASLKVKNNKNITSRQLLKRSTCNKLKKLK